MKLVVIESPYGSSNRFVVARNLRFLQACMHDCIVNHGEAPFASHGLYTQPGVLDDQIKAERKLGIEAGFAWREVAEATIIYTNLGITEGMRYGIQHAEKLGRPMFCRTLESWVCSE